MTAHFGYFNEWFGEATFSNTNLKRDHACRNLFHRRTAAVEGRPLNGFQEAPQQVRNRQKRKNCIGGEGRCKARLRPQARFGAQPPFAAALGPEIQSMRLKSRNYLFSTGGPKLRRSAERPCVSHEVKRRKPLVRLAAPQNSAALKRIQRIFLLC